MSLAYNVPYESYPPDVLHPTPAVLATLNPASIVLGPPPKLVTVTGTGFTTRSRVWADEEQQATTFVSDTSLTYMAQADQVGAQDITVHNGGAVSNSLSLAVTAAQAEKGSASPGDTFTPESSIIGSTTTQAGKLEGLGYVADPTTEWAAGEQITVNGYAFHWDGAAWQPGAAP